MTIQFLRYIVLVAEIGSITKAARQLHISQPSLSAALKEAEKEVGFAIFKWYRINKRGRGISGIYKTSDPRDESFRRSFYFKQTEKNSVFVFQRNIILLRPMPVWKWFKNLFKKDLSLS